MLMVIVMLWWAVFKAESTTLASMVTTPEAVGVPVIMPSLVPKLRPIAWRPAPLVATPHTSPVPVPPADVSVCENGAPT